MYAKVENGAITAYPYGKGSLCSDNPNVSFPPNALSKQDIRDSFGVVEVELVAMPSKVGHKAAEATPKLVDGKWVQQWDLVLKEPSEVNLEEVTETDQPKQDGKIAFIGNPTYAWDGDKWTNNWVFEDCSYRDSRLLEYGTAIEQIEFITENSLKDWKDKVDEIKAKYPKQ